MTDRPAHAENDVRDASRDIHGAHQQQTNLIEFRHCIVGCIVVLWLAKGNLHPITGSQCSLDALDH